MTVTENVRRYIVTLAPAPVCDDCIAGEVMLPARRQASRAASELASAGGFVRIAGACSLCGYRKKVIRAPGR